jgi:hypothetical protein
MNALISLATAGCIALALAVPASSQMLRADIPFAFQVDNSEMTAGPYRISVDIPARRVYLNNDTGRFITSVFLTTTSKPQAPGHGNASLVFHKYGDQYFLRTVQTAGSGVILPVSKSERFLNRAESQRNGPALALVRITVQ